ncbi:peptidase [Mycobacterium arosiense ATCC BAA-1401 = DSM 45069]|uniref:Peptidase n=2 Tax=Mycobacterium arosiense TaxID=425468 RepID=A0A1W9ZAC3_MYCAI|nr:Xaa-Pro peptidase family protein [Mycobacterium arosiense]ORA10356.1 peptidase [Mycobacterium arosiense ATCC BAA-1401 = DSM 45069]
MTSMQTRTSTIDIPDEPDLARMRRATGARLRSAMADRGIDELILLGNNAVVYATGTSWPLGDAGLSHVERPVAVVFADDEFPHLFLPFREGASFEAELPADHVHGPVYLEFDEGVEDFARRLAELTPTTGRAEVAVDECTGAMSRAPERLFPTGRPVDATEVVSAAQVIKTSDELACIRTACRITDEAMVDVQAALAPGIRQIDLSAVFMRRAFELGATASMLEPIWQVMPQSKADGVWTTHGDLALPLLTTEREVVAGDVLWTDVSISYRGYCSDFGRTWVVGRDPTLRQQAQFIRWQEIITAVLEVTRPGVTAAELGKAATKANGGNRPWLPHFYLGHGIGTYAAETPLIGTDLGDEFDENFVFEPGMVLVLEPVVWEDGTGGYRSEEIIVITEEGWMPLTDYPYHPYGH